MENNDQKEPKPIRRPSLLVDMAFSAVSSGVVVALGVLGFQKASSWAKGTKAVYNLGNLPTYGALGGAIGGAINHEEGSRHDQQKLTESNLHLRHEIDLLKLEKNYADQIAQEKNKRTIQLP